MQNVFEKFACPWLLAMCHYNCDREKVLLGIVPKDAATIKTGNKKVKLPVGELLPDPYSHLYADWSPEGFQ